MDINDLVHEAGTNSKDHGFHDDWPVPPHQVVHENHTNIPMTEDAYNRQLSLAITEKLALIHEEISEALGEIRSGIPPLLTYYRDKNTGLTEPHQQWSTDGLTAVPLRKPEGFMVELADAVIRIADLAFLVGGDLEGAIVEKHEYNRTRPYKHGRKF